MKLSDLSKNDYIYNENNGLVREAEEYMEMDSIEGLELYKATEKEICLAENSESLTLNLLLEIEKNVGYEGFVEDALFLLSDEIKELIKLTLKAIERDLPIVFDIDMKNRIEG